MRDKMIGNRVVEDVVFDLLKKASTGVPSDVRKALEEAYEDEENEVPKM